jgi:hypothetical protein
MVRLLHCLLLVALVLGPTAHGSALAQGVPHTPVLMAADQTAAHHPRANPCDEDQRPEPEHAGPCCAIGHCLIGLVIEYGDPPPSLAAARPVATTPDPALAEPQDNPERPPQRT